MAETTLTYQSDATRTYADGTQTYGNEDQRAAGTLHNLAIGETITPNEASYAVTGVISQHTGEAVIYTIRNQQGQELALKLYFEFAKPKEEPNPEALRRIRQITDPDILRLHDFGTGANNDALPLVLSLS